MVPPPDPSARSLRPIPPPDPSARSRTSWLKIRNPNRDNPHRQGVWPQRESAAGRLKMRRNIQAVAASTIDSYTR